MLVYHNDLKERLAIAREVSMELVSMGLDEFQSLESRLEYLKTYANHEDKDNTRCLLYSDFAPHSFGWTMFIKDNDWPTRNAKDIQFSVQYPELKGYRPWLNGGLIFHGKHDNGGDGGGPTFSVNLTPTNGWGVHT